MSKPNSEERHTAGLCVIAPMKRSLICTKDAERILADTESAQWDGDHDRAEEDVANARRIVAMWNATQGISTASLESGVLGELVDHMEEITTSIAMPGWIRRARAILAKLKGTP